MKTLNKKWLLFAGFLLLIIVLTAAASWLFYPRNNLTEDAADAISGNCLLSEPEDTVDIVFVGDSNAYASFSPVELWREYGLTSYVCATSAQPICETVDFVKAAFITQHPKLIVLEADNIYRDCSIGKYCFTKLKSLIPVLQYHDRWKLIGTPQMSLKKNFTRSDVLRGYKYDPQIMPYLMDTSNYMDIASGSSVIQRGAEWSIADIQKICEENEAELLIVCVPNLNWDNARHESVNNLAERLNIPFLDMNTVDDFDGIDWKLETKDAGVHVNHSGALKISSYIGRYISEKYTDITDHSNDGTYSFWNDYLKEYDQYISNGSM